MNVKIAKINSTRKFVGLQYFSCRPHFYLKSKVKILRFVSALLEFHQNFCYKILDNMIDLNINFYTNIPCYIRLCQISVIQKFSLLLIIDYSVIFQISEFQQVGPYYTTILHVYIYAGKCIN